MADIRKTIEILFEGNDQASRKAADVLGKIKEMEAQAKVTAGGTDQLENSLDRVGRTSVGLGLVNAAMVTLAGSLAFKAFVDANVSVEKFENGLRAVQGTSVDAGAQLAYVRDTASRLGLDVRSTADSFVQLTAATQGTALQGKSTRDIFEAVATAMGSLGKSSTDTEGAFRAIEQIVSKGKVSMEELRGQLGDRLPGALQIAARSMGVTTAEFESLVKKGVSAEEFLPRFAAELNKTFAGASFDSYQANMSRLRNSIDELLAQAGKSGLFSALTSGVEGATQATKEIGVSMSFYGDVYSAVARLMRGGDFDQFGEDLDRAKDRAQVLGASLELKLNQSLAETNRLLRQNSEAAEAAFRDNQTDAETARLGRMNKVLEDSAKATAELDGLLKRLGVDPKKTTDAVANLARDLETLATNPKANGELFAQAFEAALKKATTTDTVRLLGEKLAVLFNDGKISATAYKDGLIDLQKAFEKVDGGQKKTKDSADEAAKALKRQADETKKAEENAQKFALEMEKLASNERIKSIEAKVKLNVAEVEAQTKRIEAAFQSINTTVESTGDLLGTLFGALKDYDNMSFAASNLIRDQIELENERRQQALDLQKDLIQAQIAQLRAQTRAVERGDSIIKVDGAGLQPHLEAFMFEILRTIQVRVNQDGLKLLLGV